MKTKILGFYILCIGLTGCLNPAEPELHILPEKFEGYVIIIFNDSKGAKELYNGDARVYKIPPSGILSTRFKQQSGWIRKDGLKYVMSDSRSDLEFFENSINPTYIHNKEISDGTVRYIVSPSDKRSYYFDQMHKKLNELFPPHIQ